jgi:ribosomal protein S18 acetylase RimI-like enzyme
MTAPSAPPTADPALLGHLNLIELSRESTRWGSGGALEESDGVLLFATGSWLPVVCNGAFRTDPDVPAEVLVARADAFFAARRRGYTVMVRDTEADADLAAACRAAGLETFGEPAPEMICAAPVEAARPDGFDLRLVSTEAQVAELLSLPRRFLAAPNVVAVVAYDEADEPLAAAITLLSHGVAGLYWVGTVEKARRSGLGRAVTAAVTNIAFDRGASLVTLQASVMGEPVYRAMGYQSIYHYEDWVRLRPPRPQP